MRRVLIGRAQIDEEMYKLLKNYCERRVRVKVYRNLEKRVDKQNHHGVFVAVTHRI